MSNLPESLTLLDVPPLLIGHKRVVPELKLYFLTHFLFCQYYDENQVVLIKGLENIEQSLPTVSDLNLVDLL